MNSCKSTSKLTIIVQVTEEYQAVTVSVNIDRFISEVRKLVCLGCTMEDLSFFLLVGKYCTLHNKELVY